MLVSTRARAVEAGDELRPMAGGGRQFAVVSLVAREGAVAPAQWAELSVLWLAPGDAAAQLVLDSVVELGGAAPSAQAPRRRSGRVPHLAEVAGLVGELLAGRVVVTWEASQGAQLLTALRRPGDAGAVLGARELASMLALRGTALPSLAEACARVGLAAPGHSARARAEACAQLLHTALTTRASLPSLAPRAQNDDRDQARRAAM